VLDHATIAISQRVLVMEDARAQLVAAKGGERLSRKFG
jgi:hypothetical protein